MKLFGVTGGMGMGKSAAAALLRARGVAVVDTDEVAREVVAPGEPALARVVERFGAGLLDLQGNLRRAELAKVVFADPAARQDLEAILHPAIRERWTLEAARWREAGRGVGVVIIPLLFETGAEADLDATISVACSSATQHQRLRERGWDREEIARRLAAQLPAEQKLARADYVVWTEGSLAVHEAQLARILGI